MNGVDLNQYRNLPDYGQLWRDGYDFAIIKLATGTNFTNPLFEKQYNGCTNAGLYVGVYTRAAETAGNGAKEAEYALKILNGRKVNLPIYYDVEGRTLLAGKEVNTRSALAFGEVIKKAGYRWGVYTSRSHFKSFDLAALKAAGASIWCAAYDNQAGMECDIWQRSDQGTVTGYSGPVDQNVLYNRNIIEGERATALNLIECFQTQSYWYNRAGAGVPVGICWHDTAGGNPELRRYVQPSTDDSQHDYLGVLIGKNQYGNHWNRMDARGAGLNAWIGKLADGTVATIQAAPWSKMPWGVGGGKYGSLNGDDAANADDKSFWAQFEICDDYAHGGACSREYFEKVYLQAVSFTAYICRTFGINPLGTVRYKGHSIPTILCHQDSYQLGFGGNHMDVYLWFNRFGRTMDDVRRDVARLMGMDVTVPLKPSVAYQTLYTGNHNPAVKEAQERLIIHGYDVGAGGADGWFGNGTLQAVKRFQADKKLSVDGVIGEKTWEALLKEPDKTEKPEQPTEPTKPTEPTVKAYPTIGVGDTGESVRDAQKLLQAHGYDIGRGGADGIFGQDTRLATLKFQKDKRLAADGIIGKDTWAKLHEAPSQKPTEEAPAKVDVSQYPMLQRGNRGAMVVKAQKLLDKRGFSCTNGGADGIFGFGTQQTVKKFQKHHALAVDGVIGKNTWDKLVNG